MADEERKAAENADAEKKKVKRFAYQDVEASVSKMMTPSVKKLLEEDYKIDMATVLPVIHQSSPALDENETIEQYSRRCIESALAMQVQRAGVNYIESKRGKKDAVVVDVEDAAKKQQEEPEMSDNEGADIYAQANAAQTKIVLMMLGMPFKVLAALVEEENIAAKFNGKKAAIVELKPDEAAHIKAKLEKAEKLLADAYVKDGAVLETEEGKKNEPETEEAKKPEPIVKKQEELGEEEALQVPGDKDTVKLKNGKDLTFADYKAALKQLAENPEIKKMVDELGVNIDDVASEMFNKIEASEYEDALGVAEASIQYVIGRKVALDAYTRKTPGFQKLKEDDDKRKGIQENKEGDPRNVLFDNMKNILKFPFQAFKTILSGKTDEELKAEADRLNLKDVHLELTTLTREALQKKLDGYESTLAKAVKNERDKMNKGKSGQVEPAKGEGTEPAPVVPETEGAGTHTEPTTSAGPAAQTQGGPGTEEPKNGGIATVPPTIESDTVVEETTAPVTQTTTTTTQQDKDGEELEPLTDVGVNATRKITEDTTRSGRGEPEGKATVKKVEYDHLPEAEKARVDAERAAKEAQAKQAALEDGEYDENDPVGRHAGGRGM